MSNNRQIVHAGLRKRPTLEGIVDYLANGQEKVKYPNREAKQIRNHPYITQLDGIGMFEMQEQQENAWKEQEKEKLVKALDIKGKSDASTQDRIISNEEWDARIDESSMLIDAHANSIRRGHITDTKTQTKYGERIKPINKGVDSGVHSIIDDAMAREMKFTLRTLHPRPGGPPVTILQQVHKGGPPPPPMGGAIMVSRSERSAAKKALELGLNALWYTGKGTLYMFKVFHDIASVVGPAAISLAELANHVDTSSIQEVGEEEPSHEQPDDEPYVPAPVQPPKMTAGPKAIKDREPQSFALYRHTGPNISQTIHNMRAAGDRRRLDRAVQRATGVY